MANHKSALKRHRQSEKKRIRNTSVKSALKTSIKGVREAIEKGDSKEAAVKFKDDRLPARPCRFKRRAPPQ